jgi:hypothetical protein
MSTLLGGFPTRKGRAFPAELIIEISPLVERWIGAHTLSGLAGKALQKSGYD